MMYNGMHVYHQIKTNSMKRVIIALAITISLVSCGGDKEETVELKDTASINTTNSPIDSAKADTGISTNGAAVRPIDTASSQRRNPKQ